MYSEIQNIHYIHYHNSEKIGFYFRGHLVLIPDDSEVMLVDSPLEAAQKFIWRHYGFLLDALDRRFRGEGRMSKWQYREIHGKKYGIVDENRKKILDISNIRRNGVEDIFLDVDREYEKSILLVPEMLEWIEQARGLLERAEFEIGRKAFVEKDDDETNKLIELIQDIRDYLRDVWRTG